jgi:hypothetical protein
MNLNVRIQYFFVEILPLKQALRPTDTTAILYLCCFYHHPSRMMDWGDQSGWFSVTIAPDLVIRGKVGSCKAAAPLARLLLPESRKTSHLTY